MQFVQACAAQRTAQAGRLPAARGSGGRVQVRGGQGRGSPARACAPGSGGSIVERKYDASAQRVCIILRGKRKAHPTKEPSRGEVPSPVPFRASPEICGGSLEPGREGLPRAGVDGKAQRRAARPAGSGTSAFRPRRPALPSTYATSPKPARGEPTEMKTGALRRRPRAANRARCASTRRASRGRVLSFSRTVAAGASRATTPAEAVGGTNPGPRRGSRGSRSRRSR